VILRLALVSVLLLQDGPVDLSYGGKKGDMSGLAGDVALKLKIEGSDAITNLVRSSMEFLSFSEIHIKGEGVRRLTGPTAKGMGHKVEYETARVDGTYDDEPYGFDFTRGSPPGDLTTNKLKQICWFLSMGGPEFRLGPKGEYSSTDPNKDAWGEGLDLMVNGLVRLPDKPVPAGGEWTADWKGAYKQKDNEGMFTFQQKAKLEKVEKGVARIAFELTGKLEIPEAKRDKNAEIQETKLAAKGAISIDTATGLITSHESAGSVTARYKGIDPNTGETHELSIEFKVDSRFTERK
jgi:hypothetical protein